MGVLRIGPGELASLAASCVSWSAGVAATEAPGTVGSSFQASAGAVCAIETEAGLAASTLSGRMTATSTHLTSAAARYSAHESDSAVVLREVAVTV